MNNWTKILKFTLKQAIKGSKFITSTAIAGAFFLIAIALTNILMSDAFNEDEQVNKLRTAYIINETDLSLETDQFMKKHEKDFP